MTAHSSEKLEAIQAVVDRVTSWQDGATEGTVEDEHGTVHAAEVLGS